MGDNPPPSNKTIDEIFFEIIHQLCEWFPSLTPFDVLNTPTKEVFEVYVDKILYDRNNKDQKTGDRVEWVTSKNATWH